MLHKIKNIWSVVLLILICHLLTTANNAYVGLSIQSSSTQINVASTYTFTINRGYDPVNFQVISSPTPVPLNTVIIFTLPSQFITISSSSNPVTCINPANSQALTCNVNVAAKTITITDYYSTSSTLSNSQVLITMYNLVNAYKAGASDNFFWQIVNPSGVVIDQGPPINNVIYTTFITFTAGTFKSCSVSASGAYVSSSSPILLTIDPADPIPTSGQLIVTLPTYWLGDPLQASTISSYPTCVGVTTVESSVTCSYNSLPDMQLITISSLSSNSISTSFSIQITGIKIPPTAGSSESVSLYSQWLDGTQINTCSSKITNIAVIPFQSATLSSNDNTAVQSSFTATLALTLSTNFYYQDSIQLTLPTDFINCQISSTTFSSFTRSSNLNTITLTSFPSSPQVIASNNNIKLTLSGISNPISTAPVSLTVGLYRNSEIYQQSVISYTATSTTVTSFSIAPDTNFVQNVGRATITISSALKIPVGSSIYLVYPSTITASAVSSSSVTQAKLDGSVVTGALYSVSNNQITFTNIFSSNFAGTVALIIDKFTNPTTIEPSTYLLQIQDQNGYPVMTGSYNISANTKALVINAITASSYQVLQTGVTYTASITTNYGFTAVSIIIPTDITIGSGFQATCAPALFSSCSLSGNNLTFIGTLSAGSYSLQWGFVSNPTSFKPTSSFQIYTYSKGFGVQNSQGVLSIAMTSTFPFSNLILYPSSYTNSANISATLILTFPTNTPAGQLSILVPSELVITSAACTGCTISSPYIYLTLSPAVTNTTIVISNLVNVGSFKPIGSFALSLKSTEGYESLYSTVSGWTNNLPSTFTTAVVGNNNYKGESNNFKFQLTGLSNAQTQIVINIDSSFGSLSTAPSGFTLVSSYALKVACVGTSCSFNFTITNPTISGTYTFTLTSYTNDDFQVGKSTSNSWTFDCSTTNCRSCQSNGSCLSCYQSSLISTFNIFNTFTKSCDRACQSGYFLINTTCSICDSNCSECQNTSKTCTACQNDYYLDTTYYLCVPSCLVGYFANSLSKTCTKCTSPCATCTSTAIFCLSCVQNYYLYNNQCLSTCPINFFIANVVTLKCDSCVSNCLTCTNTTSYCLSCNNTQGLYFQNNVCVTNCSTNYFLVNNICTYCALPCKVCTGSISVCSSCFLNSTTPIFYKNYCISSSQCPIGFYVNTTNSSCQTCPVNCSQCSSTTVCSSCSLGYYIYGTLCLSSCPNTTFLTSNSTTGLCQACNNCLTCNSSTACTSCISSQFLYNAICYSTCPSGSYPTGTICAACNTGCPTCQNFTFCTSCTTSMYLYKGECYLVCPNSTFPNATLQICSSCPASCATCTSLSVCQTCVTSYSLEDSQCVLICSKGLSFNQICYPCGLNCDICQDTTCSKCVTSYYLYNNTCLSQCPVNMLSLDSMNCVLCTNKFINCTTCNLNECLKCAFGQLVNGTCIPCSPGYYAQSSACTLCPSTCSTCESQTICTSCKTNNYLLNNMCSSSCPINMFPNGTTCSVCLANCNICNQATSLCSVCQAGYYLYNNLCSRTCPSPLVVSYDFLTCVTEAVYYEQFSKAAKIVPFPFTIASIVIIIIAVILRFLHKEMHLQTLLVAIISIIQISCWLIFIGFENLYYNNYHKLALYGLIGGVIGVGFLALFNFVHLRFFYKYISDDQQFTKWVRKNSCSNKSILTFATILSFKFYRLVHSKFLGREQTSMVLSSPNRLIPFSLITVISIFVCSIPVFIGCGLALYNSISQDQQFFIALDTITVTGLMIILMVMDLKHPDDYFIDEHEAKNLKKKVYQEDQIKFQEVFHNPMEDNVSHEQLVLQEDEGDMALPPSATKFKSTMYPNQTKQPLNGEQSCDAGSQENIIEDEQSEQPISNNVNKWRPKQYDHHGYLIKYDANNNQVRYDQNGYRVQIDDKGVHRRYNTQGHQMKLVDGKWVPHDEDGFRLSNGKRYNEKGYQIRDQNGQHVPYDQYGFKVVGEGQNERHIDQNGYTIKIDQNGKIRRYQQDGRQVVKQDGKVFLKDKEGRYVRKNKDGQWEIYDPKDGFTLKINPKTGQYQKYNDLGFRVVKDSYGNLHYYDEQGYKVTILPGNQIIRHDDRNYRIQKDQNGKIHRFDEDGFELIQDENGNFKFIDKNGYRVERDFYGRVTLYDEDGNQVRIDQKTGIHHKFNEQGLQVVKDYEGNIKLIDKRGRVVKELDGTYEKYDKEGNKIWLDQNGYEIEQDEEGNVNRYDKVGDRVNTQYEIQQSEQYEGELMLQTFKKPPKYKYKHLKEADQEEELNKLLSVNQPLQFEEQLEMEELHEFHDNYFPKNEKDVDYQFDRLVNKERSELIFKEEDEKGLQDLQQFQHQQELYGNLVQPNLQSLDAMLAQKNIVNGSSLPNENNLQADFDNQLIIKINDDEQSPNYLNRQAQKGNHSLVNRQLKMQQQFDNQLIMRNLDEKEPHLQNRAILANHHLVDKQLNRQGQFDKQFTVKDLDAKEPQLYNKALQGHGRLKENQSGIQAQYDKEAIVKDIDQNEPDPIELKKRDLQRAEEARKRAINNNLKIARDQEYIQIKSVADISVDQRSFENQGVHPLQNRTDFDEIHSLDEIEVPLGRKQRGNRSEVSLVNNKKNTQTVYNYNTVQVSIKNQNNLYDEDQDIESLHQEDWQQQMNPMMFPKRQKVKDESQGHNNSNANTNILYIEDQQQDKDALSEFVHQSQSKTKIKPNPVSNSRYHKMNDMLSRQVQSIEQIQEKLFRQASNKKQIRQRREFRLSGAPNPLVEYAKTMEANKKSLQQRMYLDHNFKK